MKGNSVKRRKKKNKREENYRNGRDKEYGGGGGGGDGDAGYRILERARDGWVGKFESKKKNQRKSLYLELNKNGQFRKKRKNK